MKKIVLLLSFCFFITFLSAQQTWMFDTKDAKVGESIQGKLTTEKPYKKYTLTSGEYLHQAGVCYLAGTSLSIIGSVFIATNNGDYTLDNPKLSKGIAIAAGGLILTIVGHTKLIQAGKALDEERKITFHPSSSGIGLALKF